MARVPIAENTVRQLPVTDAKLRAFDGGGGTMGGIAAGLGKAGAALSDFVAEQDNINAVYDEARAKDLDNQYVSAARELLVPYQSQFGENALKGRADVEKGLKDLRDGLMSKTQSKREKTMLANVLDRRFEQDMFGVGTHATREGKTYAIKTSQARSELASLDALRNADDPNKLAASLNTGIGEIRSRGQLEGWGEDVTNAAVGEFRSNTYATIIDSKAAGDPLAAKQWLDDHRSEIDPDKAAKLDAALAPALTEQAADSAADGLMGTVVPSVDGDLPSPSNLPIKGRVTSSYGMRKHPIDGEEKFHKGVDIAAAAGSPVGASDAGTVTFAGPKGGYGNYVMVRHADGSETAYAHLSKIDVKVGDAVTRGGFVGAVGSTGKSTGPHLHFERYVRGKPVDPTGTPRQRASRDDLEALLAAADRAYPNDYRMREAVKASIIRKVGMNDRLLDRQHETARNDALETVDRLGEKFTSINQLPPSIRDAMSPQDRITLKNQAEANAKGENIPANGDTVIGLNLMATAEPDKFGRTDLRMYRHMMTRSEFANLAELQVKLRTNPKAEPVVQHEAIWGMINRYAPDLDLKVGKGASDNDRAKTMKIFTSMKANLDARTKEMKRAPTDDEVKAAFDKATMEVVVKGGGWFGDDTRRVFELEGDERVAIPVPKDVRARIVASYNRRGVNPTDEQVATTFYQYKNRPGFW